MLISVESDSAQCRSARSHLFHEFIRETILAFYVIRAQVGDTDTATLMSKYQETLSLQYTGQ